MNGLAEYVSANWKKKKATPKPQLVVSFCREWEKVKMQTSRNGQSFGDVPGYLLCSGSVSR